MLEVQLLDQAHRRRQPSDPHRRAPARSLVQRLRALSVREHRVGCSNLPQRSSPSLLPSAGLSHASERGERVQPGWCARPQRSG